MYQNLGDKNLNFACTMSLYYDILLTVHLNIFILILNNLMH